MKGFGLYAYVHEDAVHQITRPNTVRRAAMARKVRIAGAVGTPRPRRTRDLVNRLRAAIAMAGRPASRSGTATETVQS